MLRVLGLSDLSLFLIAALVNLNSVPVVASVGPSAILFWLMGFFLFFVPEAIAVLELSKRYPQEGGIYLWTKTAFGDFHGFLSGWFYWINNIFYIPTLLFYIVGFAVFIGGEHATGLGDNPLFMISVSLLVLWMITILNIRGLGAGKWVQNIGALGTFVITAVILAVGLITLRTHAMATDISIVTIFPAANDWRTISLLSVVCLNFVGVELGSVIGDEIKDPLRNIPRAVFVSGLCTVLLYVLITFALQATVPASSIGVIDGILQATQRAATDIQLPVIVVPIAILMSFNAAGNMSAWLAGSARIPFVIGIDRYLPATLGKMHPRFSTPHVALVVQGIASTAVVLINGIGTTVHDVYIILLQTTVVLTLIPFLYMFAALIKVKRSADRVGAGAGFFRSPWICYGGSVLGFCMTAIGIVLALVPSNSVNDARNFEFKTLIGIVAFTVPALIIYRVYQKKLQSRVPIPEPIGVTPE